MTQAGSRSAAPTDTADPRDPHGLRSDAPLLDAWLRFTAQAEAGLLNPMAVPGHKQRQDLTGAVVGGDAPLYGALDSIKHADVLLGEAENRAARLWGADWCRFSVAGLTHGTRAGCPPRWRWTRSGRRWPATPGLARCSSATRPMWGPPGTWPDTRRRRTRRASRSSWTPPGRHTWASTPACRRTRSRRARTAW